MSPHTITTLSNYRWKSSVCVNNTRENITRNEIPVTLPLKNQRGVRSETRIICNTSTDETRVLSFPPTLRLPCGRTGAVLTINSMERYHDLLIGSEVRDPII